MNKKQGESNPMRVQVSEPAGRPGQPPAVTEPAVSVMPPGNKLVCPNPNCHSENVQSFQMAYAGGLSSQSTNTVGFLWNAGLGAAKSQTTNVTALAQSVAPPGKKGYWKKALLAPLAAAFVSSITNSAILGWLALAGVVYWIYRSVYLWNRDVYPQLMDEWLHSYICYTCGNRFYIPGP